MEKINIAELLKDCPKGMELDCTMYDNLSYDYIDKEQNRIFCKVDLRDTVWFTIFGCVNLSLSAKCVIFPKGKTTWEGFQRPFKAGDILTNKSGKPFILKAYLPDMNNVWSYCGIDTSDGFHKSSDNWTYAKSVRFATEEEKAILFKAIKDNGYKWNADDKKLEKLVEPKFKVGDKIERFETRFIISDIKDNYYLTKCGNNIRIDNQDNFKLVPNKFDITTLKPFDKVLVRHNKDNKWCASFFSHTDKDFHSHCYKYVTTAGKSYPYCIPYEENKELRGTTNDCDEYYKTWQ